ncbi:PP2C family protein-serine/threonine phosphatase [Actinospica robiniae]|uniref:PP2C family protein-serine/threonine phosphatase n=1 Tax=Actinospica robiniae TaxID=304901 RepID=UPI0004044B9F|nr:PP2C family protein-serine/threonine phosphatase [Actinospica robiniae]
MQRDIAVERALSDADPDRLPEVLEESLCARYDARAVELRLVDYAIHSLQPVRRGRRPEPVPVEGTVQGRVFACQEPEAEEDGQETTVHLPASFRGDRVGVLSVTVPTTQYTPATLEELRRIAAVIAREVILAGRESDRYEVERRVERLTLAAEMQWLLLPGRSCTRPEFSLGAHLEPAYAIYGDGFDWSVSAESLTLAVVNGMGEGVEASLLTSLAISALRNARRAGLPLADQAMLADEAVFARHRGDAHVEALLLRLELGTGRLEIVDAGSPHLWRVHEGGIEPLSPEAQMPLGMFGDTHYRPETLYAKPGDRLLIASDGVYAAPSPGGEKFEERALAEAVEATRSLPPAQVPAAMLRALADHYGETLLDDAIVTCIDWHGPRPEGVVEPS